MFKSESTNSLVYFHIVGMIMQKCCIRCFKQRFCSMFMHFICNELIVIIRQWYGNKLLVIYISKFPLNCLEDTVFIQPNSNGIHVLTMANINDVLPMKSMSWYHNHIHINSVMKYNKTLNPEANNYSVHEHLWVDRKYISSWENIGAGVLCSLSLHGYSYVNNFRSRAIMSTIC